MEERFWSKVDRRSDDECWPWTASLDAYGYGQFHVGTVEGRKTVGKAHRIAYELLVGPIPAGLVIDHLCRNRSCVNPAHMEPVAPTVNTLRGEGFGAVNARKDTCPAGHPYDVRNTYERPAGGRDCRKCTTARSTAWRRRKASA